jgi:hypothetical protein
MGNHQKTMMKKWAAQDLSNKFARREFVKGCLAGIGATCVINGEPEMKTTATEDMESTDEAQIRKRIDDWVTAFRRKDINSVLPVFAPETVAFDLVPPLAYAGREAYRKQSEKLFASYQGPIEYEVRDLRITATVSTE